MNIIMAHFPLVLQAIRILCTCVKACAHKWGEGEGRRKYV